MIYDKSAYELRALNVGVDYWVAIEAFGESGVGERSESVALR